MSQLLVYGLMALALAGTVGAGVHYVKAWGANEVRAEWKAAEEATRQREAENSAKAVEELQAERAKRKVIVKERTTYVDREVEKPVYRNVCIGDDGLRCLNAAINGKDAAGCKIDRGVPETRPPA